MDQWLHLMDDKQVAGAGKAVTLRNPATGLADAAIAILERPGRECTGNTFPDMDVLREEGVVDLSPPAPGELEYDIFRRSVPARRAG